MLPPRSRPGSAGLLLALVAVAAAACLGSSVPSTDGPSATPVETPVAASATTGSETPTPGPVGTPTGPASTVGAASTPPGAHLVGAAGGPVAGVLGTNTWDGVTSDAPWIVPTTATTIDHGAHLRIRFDAGPPVTSWTANWARIANGVAGTPRPAGSGDGKPLTIDAPPGPGGWSLQVDARFGGDERAVWYWRVKVDR